MFPALTRTGLTRMGGVALAAALTAAPAASALAVTTDPGTYPDGNGTVIESVPDTPKVNPKLPLVETTRKSDRIKPNILNAHPVCNAWEDYRTVVYEVKDHFEPIGSVETKNTTDSPIKLTQTLSKTQTITSTTTGDIGGSFSGVTAKISQSISYSLSWTQGQTIGPYDVPVGYTGKANYGFRTVTFKGTQQRCLLNGTWSNTWAYSGKAPLSAAVEVKLYKNNADA